MRGIVVGLLMILATQAACLELSVVSSDAKVKKGSTMVATINVKNDNAVLPPVLFTAKASYIDEYGVVKESSASASVNISQDVKLSTISVPVPDAFDFVVNSAKFNGAGITAMSTDGKSLVVDVNKTLVEQESGSLVLSFKAR